MSHRPSQDRRNILDKALTRNEHIITSPAEAGSSKKILTFVKHHGHNYHHGHVAQGLAGERFRYRASRHPLIILFGYVIIFAVTICLMPLVRDPKRHWDSALFLLAQVGLITLLWFLGGVDLAFFTILLPMTLASALAGYLLFAQHSFKRMYIASPQAWSFYRAAL